MGERKIPPVGAPGKERYMEQEVRVTLVANAGVLLEYQGTTLLLDGIYGPENHPFSNLPPEVWNQMKAGEGPFEKIDYLLFSHAHPDHFSPAMTMEYLKERNVKGVFLPQTRSVRESGLPELLKERGIPAAFLCEETDHTAYRVEPGIAVRAFTTLHLDKKYHHVHHFCYLLTFGEKHILFCADVDYTREDFSRMKRFPLRAAFVNPLFFAELRRRRFFHGELEAGTVCIYHVPFSGEDEMHMRPVLANDMVKFSPEQEVRVLCSPFQQLKL